MKRFGFVAMMGVFLLTHPVWAEMYRYKDAAGVIRFTDNLADVPVKQRAGVSVYESAPSPAVPPASEEASGRNSPGDQHLKNLEDPAVDSASDSPQSEEFSNDPSRIDRLLKIKTALDEENAQLMKESLILSEEEKSLSGNAAVQAYNEKVKALNARVDDYEMRRIAFQKEADAFDAAFKKRLHPPPASPQTPSP